MAGESKIDVQMEEGASVNLEGNPVKARWRPEVSRDRSKC